jgi:hypothetical protein
LRYYIKENNIKSVKIEFDVDWLFYLIIL